jgi:DNA-dependent RNA polymerase auxiliary subunit epsilon
MEKYSLNEETLKFILNFEDSVVDGTVFTNADLVEKFKQSTFYHREFESYIPTAINKAIWYAVKRSGNWDMKKGVYQKRKDSSPNKETTVPAFEADINVPVRNKGTSSSAFNREEYIRHLSKNLFDVLMLKREITDDFLRKYHLSSKGIGDDLYFLTESYFRQKGFFKGKHSMSDYITLNAKKAIESGNISKNLIYEHMIPKNLYIKQISEVTLAGELTEAFIYDLLIKYYFVCTVTKEEDDKLPSIKMDDDWDGINPFYRYEKAGVEFSPNKRICI